MDYKGRGPTTARISPVPTLAALLLLALGVGGCGREADSRAPAPEEAGSVPGTGPAPRPNVVLVLADTLRADHLGAYGYERDTSPRFDALAAESYLFEDVRAQAPCTFPSTNSILTGRPTRQFLGQPGGGLGIPETIPSIAEILHGAGYATAAISASPIVRATPGDMNPEGGFARGFDRFSESCQWLGASCVNHRAGRFLDDLPEPFFLYLHYLDPHDPYGPPETWTRRFADGGEGLSEAVRNGDPNPIANAIYKQHDPSLATPESLAHLVDLYDDDIAYWDSRLGLLLDDLAARGVLDHTLLIVLSDHGESFFEHREMRHCRSVWDHEIRTPLLVRLPPVLAPGPPRRIGSQAANVDLVPTLLDYLEIPAGGLGLAGTSLRPAIESASADRGPVFSDWHGLHAVKQGRLKLIVRERGGASWLYDVAADPGETDDLSTTHVRERARLRRLIRDRLARGEAGGAEEAEEAMDRLRDLGYLQ